MKNNLRNLVVIKYETQWSINRIMISTNNEW